METSLGAVRIRLDAEKAPLTVDNFLDYVDGKHYDQTIFHQVLKEYPRIVLGGAFTADLAEKPTHGAPVRNEAQNGLPNRRGTIAMARSGDAVDSATCHFFINLTDNQNVLDHRDQTLEGYGYCVFGEVIDGMDVVDKIGASDVKDADGFEHLPVSPVTITSLRRAK
jgi:cyclophilin family peptidyl-prolyl cis-trans isomerase